MNTSSEVTSNFKEKIEKDMRPWKYQDTDRLSSKVFKNYPLVGDFIISDATLEQWYKVTRKYVNQKIGNRSLQFKHWVYEIVSLVVIHYAKGWNSNEESKFTKYIAMQLGYRDDTGRIWGALTDALYTAFKRNNRLFIKRNDDREFYETVMVHSFGPKESWYPLIELLFSFYSVNLEWNYVPKDPLFMKLVLVLQRHFNNDLQEEDQYFIASSNYRLKVGIRRLVQERPYYCARLFETMVHRIHQLLQNDVSSTKRYSYKLVDEWFAQRISSANSVTSDISRRTRVVEEVALDYSNIVIRYALSEGKLVIRIPSIRLLDDEEAVPIAALYEDQRLISSYPLDIHGNELGETIRSKTIVLEKDFLRGIEIHYRLVITRGTTVVHDTGRKLWRSVLFFSDGREISVNRLKKERYEVYALNPSRIGGINVDVTLLESGLCDVRLHKNYSIEYENNTIAIDSSELTGIRVVAPSLFGAAHYLLDGKDFDIVKPFASLKVYLNSENDARKYSLVINGEYHSLFEYFDFLAGNRCLIEIDNIKTNSISLSVVDIAAGVTVFKGDYYKVLGLSWSFSKKCYVFSEEPVGINARITCGTESYSVTGSGETTVHVEYQGGILSIDVPYLQYRIDGVSSAFFDKYYRSEDIEENSSLRLINNSGSTCTVKIGNVNIQNPELIYLSKYLPDKNETAVLKISVNLDNEEYFVAGIVYGNFFLKPPVISGDGEKLTWDGGLSYIGDTPDTIELIVTDSDNNCYGFEPVLGQTLIADSISDLLPDGEYDWSLLINGQTLSTGRNFLGNPCRARFVNKIVRIDRITKDIEADSDSIAVKPAYIDNIKYVDTSYVETEGDIYDVYTGCMYWLTYTGKKRYFSFSYVSGKNNNNRKEKYKVNPVKIIYISEKYLRIVNEDNEGLYCYNNIESSIPGYEITDIEPPRRAKGFLDILFFLYDLEVIKGRSPKGLEMSKKNSFDVGKINRIPSMVSNPSSSEPSTVSNAFFKNIKEVDQSRIIQSSAEERILVNAGPGTGKTWTLIERIIYLVINGTDPESIQVLCFSRAAVEVIRARVAEAIETGRVDVSVNRVDIRTFDSFASQVLFWVKDSDYSVINKTAHIEELSYEDRINLFTKVLNIHPELIEQCVHLIVDEVQDLVMSRAGMVLAMISLLPDSCGVTLFGDACQSIYDYQVSEGLSSTEFYKRIEETGQFSYYSFSHNYRQVSELQSYCEGYREAILKNDIKECNRLLSRISERLPDYSPVRIKDFEEDSLDRLLTGSNIGILTRSNAQTMFISRIFRKKNIPHVIQRRLADDCLSGWIALLFNSISDNFLDEVSFSHSLRRVCDESYISFSPEELWDSIVAVSGGMSSHLTGVQVLNGIMKCGKIKGVYAESPVSPVTISTIHRSKGREYDTVILLDSLISEETDSAEEQRVNYVALSRAKKHMYKVELNKHYFSRLGDQRCYRIGISHNKKRYLYEFEIGLPGDLALRSFCIHKGVQSFLRQKGYSLVDREVYFERQETETDYVIYNVIDKENGMVLANTSREFATDLSEAIRKAKKLPWNASIYNYLYPKRFNDIFITAFGSEIGMMQGNEVEVKEYTGIITWNVLFVEGYAKAEY